MDMQVNQIVRGIKAGVFVVLALRSVGGEPGAQVKAVNPANLAEVAPGELWLPLSALRGYGDEFGDNLAGWADEGRDAYFAGAGALCPYDGASAAGRAWDAGWLQARHDDREARACGIY